MIDWLRRGPERTPTINVGGRDLPLAIRRIAHARRMTLRLAPDGSEVRVSMPHWGRSAEALAFARARIDWLEDQLEALPVAEPPRHGSAIAFRGIELTIHHDASWPRRVRPAGGALHIGGPADSLAPRLKRWLEGEARVLLAADLAEYCAKAGVPPPALALSSARRRWGSCSARGTIRINWRLVMAPDAVRRSVVAHEVAHLVHFDHGPDFHALLAELYEGSVTEANRWLKVHGRSLCASFG